MSDENTQHTASKEDKQMGEERAVEHILMPVYRDYPLDHGNEVDLLALVRGVLGKWKKIVCVGILSGALALIFLMSRGDVYLSVGKLTVSLDESRANVLGLLGLGVEAKPNEIAAHLAGFFTAPALLRSVYADVYQGVEESPSDREMTDAVSVEVPKDAGHITVSVSDREPAWAKALADGIIARGIADIEKLLSGRYQEQLAKVQKRSASSEQAWKDAAAQALAVLAKTQMPLRRKELEILRERVNNHTAALLELEEIIAEGQAELAAARLAIGTLEPTRSFRRSLANAPEVMASVVASEAEAISTDALAKLEVDVEERNGLYDLLEQKIAVGEVALATNKARLEVISKQMTDANKRIPALEKILAEDGARLARAEQLRDLARSDYEQARQREWSVMALRQTVQNPLAVMQAAVEPSHAVSSRSVLTATLVAMVSSFIACVWFMFAFVLQERSEGSVVIQ